LLSLAQEIIIAFLPKSVRFTNPNRRHSIAAMLERVSLHGDSSCSRNSRCGAFVRAYHIHLARMEFVVKPQAERKKIAHISKDVV
jgi:hypothetical protein